MDNYETNSERKVQIISGKTNQTVEFIINDECLAKENYECIGCSNSDYGS